MKQEQLKSEALSVNIARTRQDQIIIPPQHKWFLKLSEKMWGFHKKTEEFIIEFNHTLSNSSFVLNLLHKIAGEDFWFYQKQPKSEKAFSIIMNFYDEIEQRSLSSDQEDKWIRSLVSFVNKLSTLQPLYINIIEQGLDLLDRQYKQNNISCIKNGRYIFRQLKSIAILPQFSQRITQLIIRILQDTRSFWQDSAHIMTWFKSKRHLFSDDCEELFRTTEDKLFASIDLELNDQSLYSEEINLLFYRDVAEYLRNSVNDLTIALERIYYLFYLVYLPGMTHLRSYLLWDINAFLRQLHNEEQLIINTGFITNIFSLFEDMFIKNTSIVLDCILTLGKEFIVMNNQELIDEFIDRTIKLGFVTPHTNAFDANGQLIDNSDHVKNIRVWLQLYEMNPNMMRELFSALVVNLHLGGVFISDTDLFQKDITKLLNSQIKGNFKQMKQLCRIFPIYFNKIGAEGEIREYSTTIDQLVFRKDELIHFFRKQIHTESNNRHIALTKAIILYWYSGDSSHLEQFVPNHLFTSLNNEASWFTGVHQVLVQFFSERKESPEEFLQLDNHLIDNALENYDQKNIDKKRVWYLFHLYLLLRDKYSLDTTDIIQKVKKYNLISGDYIDAFSESIERKDNFSALVNILDIIEKLNEIVLDPSHSKGWENIYHKRHIAVGIPSMYGMYHEKKFESLGSIFRCEHLASRLFEKYIASINTNIITLKTLHDIECFLTLVLRGLSLDGITNQSLESNLKMLRYSLKTTSFSLDQYRNIFQFMQESVQEIINKYFFRVYDHQLQVIIPKLYPIEKLSEFKIHSISENFFRANLSSAFIIQMLDTFISSVIKKIATLSDSISSELSPSLLRLDVNMTMCSFDEPNKTLDNPVFLGAKANNLKKLYNNGLPVPHGFVLTTELFRHRTIIRQFTLLTNEINACIKAQIKHLESLTGCTFGDVANPLILSVRSGTAFSMPGAMNTFLNVGLNEKIVKALSKQENFGWTSWDCYRRLLQGWGMSQGILRDVFDNIIISFKEKYNIEKKTEFTSTQMREIAHTYNEVLINNHIELEQDVYKQLEQAILMVMDSWDSDRSIIYREHLRIADEWGTAVIIQNMVLGNINLNSGTGVVFTHDPSISTSGVSLYGDFVFCSQGEDIVAGLVHTQPVSMHQPNTRHDASLEAVSPQIYQRLYDLAIDITSRLKFNHQEIEFTFESDDPESLSILQIRNQNIQKQSIRTVFKAKPKEMEYLGNGVGIGGGAMCGLLAFNMEDIINIRTHHPESNCILLRPDTVPDDIGMIFKADGLITGRGGATSHAAVTASRLQKVCIVNCRELRFYETDHVAYINKEELHAGEPIAIDGSAGIIYRGLYETEEENNISL